MISSRIPTMLAHGDSTRLGNSPVILTLKNLCLLKIRTRHHIVEIGLPDKSVEPRWFYQS